MKLRFTLAELSGALGDLGRPIPLTLALITLNGVNAASAFVVIGLAYLLRAFAGRRSRPSPILAQRYGCWPCRKFPSAWRIPFMAPPTPRASISARSPSVTWPPALQPTSSLTV